eukprot:GDKI01037176.1.p1 GENE.GDKI01037176.1~~GDKI01037176.1.p1  ORF type:complete len:353 (-),score=87.74 GDKI01037176.1:19-1026(-)
MYAPAAHVPGLHMYPSAMRPDSSVDGLLAVAKLRLKLFAAQAEAAQQWLQKLETANSKCVGGESVRGHDGGMYCDSGVANLDLDSRGGLFLPEWFAPHPHVYGESFYLRAAVTSSDKVLRADELWRKPYLDWVHNYEFVYEKYLPKYRHTLKRPVRLLEIGLGCNMLYGPGSSYKFWLDYFPHVQLYFIEGDGRCVELMKDHVQQATVYIGDQANMTFLQQVVQSTGGNFDVIVDDGGHMSTQQLNSLEVLFPSLATGGVYILEDLFASYMPEWDPYIPRHQTAIEETKRMIDQLNKKFTRKEGSQMHLPHNLGRIAQLADLMLSVDCFHEVCVY